MVAGAWITVVPYLLNGATLSAEDFRDNLRIRYRIMPLYLHQTCNGCGEKLTVEHTLHCKRGGLVTVCHNDVSAEWGTLCAAALTSLAVAHKPLINYGGRLTVKGRATAEAENEELDSQKDMEREERQGYDKDLTADNKEESGEKGFHNFLKRGTT